MPPNDYQINSTNVFYFIFSTIDVCRFFSAIYDLFKVLSKRKSGRPSNGWWHVLSVKRWFLWWVLFPRGGGGCKVNHGFTPAVWRGSPIETDVLPGRWGKIVQYALKWTAKQRTHEMSFLVVNTAYFHTVNVFVNKISRASLKTWIFPFECGGLCN